MKRVDKNSENQHSYIPNEDLEIFNNEESKQTECNKLPSDKQEKTSDNVKKSTTEKETFESNIKECCSSNNLPVLFSHISESDSAFVAGLMFLLFEEGCTDIILFCILGYLLF